MRMHGSPRTYQKVPPLCMNCVKNQVCCSGMSPTFKIMLKQDSVTSNPVSQELPLQDCCSSLSLEQCSATGVPPQVFRCAANFYKKLYICTL
jgi:hypothetical protein